MNRVVTNLIQQGLAQHRLGQFGAAEFSYARALSLDPKNPDALHLSGIISHQQGNHHEAIKRIQRAIDLAPQSTFYNSLGESLRALQQSDKAIAAYRCAIDMSPRYAAAHHNLGLALASAGHLNNTNASLRRALHLEPGDAQTLNQLGQISRRLQRPQEARDFFRKALDANPDDVEARANLANLLTATGETETSTWR